MVSKISFLLYPPAWLLALLVMASALPARADEEDFPYVYTLTEDGTGYIISPDRYNCKWDQELFMEVPAKRPCDGLPVLGLEGFEYCERLMDLFFEEGCQVKYIGANAFKGCKCIWNVVNFPETIESIGDYAFYGCTDLPNLTFGHNLKTMGVSCFEKCTSLTEIVLPNSLKVLREWAFRYCTGLKTVVFENEVDFYTDGVFGFYNNVFDGCTSLSSVTLPNDTPDYFYVPMGTFKDCSSLKSIVFPSNTRRIEQMSFYRSGLETLDLTTIGEHEYYLQGWYTFAACENLRTITAKGKLRFDGLYTFQDCKALESVTITGENDDYAEFCPDIFRYCDNLESVNVYRLKGTGYTNEMDSVFVGCKKLKQVTSTCTPEFNKIGYSCFDGCTSLESVAIPAEAFVISETAFRDCAALTDFNFTNVTTIGKGSFKGCVSLTGTTGIAGVTSIGESAFEGCTQLPSLQFTNLESIGTKAFSGCSSLLSISFNSKEKTPPTVASEDAFDAWHYATTEIDVLEEKYREFAANDIWKKFDHLKRPAMFAYEPVTGGYSISKGLYALDEDFTGMLEIPAEYNSANVVAIANGAFSKLSGITGITLPEGLTSIGATAFGECTNVTTVISNRVEPLTVDACPEDAFDSAIYASGTLYVPFGSIDAYSSTSPWNSFNGRIKQGIGERTLAAPEPSREAGVFNDSFDLTLTNPNESGTIYYYIIPEGEAGNEVHTSIAYTDPITIDATCTVVAYITDGTNCCEPLPLDYTYVYLERLAVNVNGATITDENCGDVLGDGGSVTYNKETATLTLSNATINSEAHAAISAEGGALIINIDGVNSINSKSAAGIFFGGATQTTGVTNYIRGIGDGDNQLTIMLDPAVDDTDGISVINSNLVIDNCSVMIYDVANGIYLTPSGNGEDGNVSVLGTSTLAIVAGTSALSNAASLTLAEGLQIQSPADGTFKVEEGIEGNIFDAEDNVSGRLYIGTAAPSRITEITNLPQGTFDVNFADLSEVPSLNNVAIGNIYYSIIDANSGYNPDAGLVLNAFSDVDAVAQFNSEVEQSTFTNSTFNGIAVKVAGTGSITFDSFTNHGDGRLTLVLGAGPVVYVDELPDGKYEFSTLEAKYLYIFATQSEATTAPSLASVDVGVNSVTLSSMTIDMVTATGIEDVPAANSADTSSPVTDIYSIDGRKLAEPVRGINIVRRADGSCSKILVK